MLNCVTLPDGIDETMVRTRLLQEYGIEIGGGLGPLRGRVWRIGLMGESSQHAHVLTLLNALEAICASLKRPVQPGRAIQAATDTYTQSLESSRRQA